MDAFRNAPDRLRGWYGSDAVEGVVPVVELLGVCVEMQPSDSGSFEEVVEVETFDDEVAQPVELIVCRGAPVVLESQPSRRRGCRDVVALLRGDVSVARGACAPGVRRAAVVLRLEWSQAGVFCAHHRATRVRSVVAPGRRANSRLNGSWFR